jgi:phosphonate transport system ATP-binding protein
MASLDPALAHTVLSLLQRISEEDGLTVVTSLHVLELARLYGRRVLGLRAGRLVYDGSPDELTDTVAEQIFAGRAA